MFEKRTRLASVCMGNKIFVVVGDTTSLCEIYDEDIGSRKCVYLNQVFNQLEFDKNTDACNQFVLVTV